MPPRTVLAYIVMTLWAGVLMRFLFWGRPVGIDDFAAGRVLGQLDSAMLFVLGFYFSGSPSPPRPPAPPAPPVSDGNQ